MYEDGKGEGRNAHLPNVKTTVPWLFLAMLAIAPDSPIITPAGSGGVSAVLSKITVLLTVIVVGGLILIFAQSYLGRRRHPPEWIGELDAELAIREEERAARIEARAGVTVSDDAAATRELLERVAQLRGIGSPNRINGEHPDHVQISAADAIENARRTPEKFEEEGPPIEDPAPAIPEPVLSKSLFGPINIPKAREASHS